MTDRRQTVGDNATPVRDQDKVMLRLPDGMRARVKAAAEKNSRSMNAEIVAALEAAFPLPEAGDGLVQFLKKWIGPLAEATSRRERADVASAANEWADKSGLGSNVLHVEEAKNEADVAAHLRIMALETTLTLWGKSVEGHNKDASTKATPDIPRDNVQANDDNFTHAIREASVQRIGKYGDQVDSNFTEHFRRQLRALDNEADAARRAVTVGDINKLFARNALGMTAWIDPDTHDLVVSAGRKEFRRTPKSVDKAERTRKVIK